MMKKLHNTLFTSQLEQVVVSHAQKEQLRSALFDTATSTSVWKRLWKNMTPMQLSLSVLVGIAVIASPVYIGAQVYSSITRAPLMNVTISADIQPGWEIQNIIVSADGQSARVKVQQPIPDTSLVEVVTIPATILYSEILPRSAYTSQLEHEALCHILTDEIFQCRISVPR